MYSLMVLDGQQPEKRNSLLHFFRFSAARDVEGDLANLKHRWRQQAAFSSAAAALTPSSGGTTHHQAPFLLAFNPSSTLLSLCLYSLKVLTAFLDPPAYMGLLWLISNNILQIDIWKRMYVHWWHYLIATSLFYEVNDPLLQVCYKP